MTTLTRTGASSPASLLCCVVMAGLAHQGAEQRPHPFAARLTHQCLRERRRGVQPLAAAPGFPAHTRLRLGDQPLAVAPVSPPLARLRLADQPVELAAFCHRRAPRPLAAQRRDAVALLVYGGAVGKAACGAAVGMTNALTVEGARVVSQAEPEIEVLAVSERLIEGADLPERAPPHHDARRTDEVAVEKAARKLSLGDEAPAILQGCEFERAGDELLAHHEALEHAALGINVLEFPEGETGLGMAGEGVGGRSELPGLGGG